MNILEAVYKKYCKIRKTLTNLRHILSISSFFFLFFFCSVARHRKALQADKVNHITNGSLRTWAWSDFPLQSSWLLYGKCYMLWMLSYTIRRMSVVMWMDTVWEIKPLPSNLGVSLQKITMIELNEWWSSDWLGLCVRSHELPPHDSSHFIFNMHCLHALSPYDRHVW